MPHCGSNGLDVSMESRGELIKDILPISLPFKTVIYLQISYFTGIMSSKFYF